MLKTAITYNNALASVDAHATSGIAANFKALAAGAMAFMIGQTWQADKALKVPTDQIKSDVLKHFRDSGDKKSKAYEFGALALTIAKDLSKGGMVASQSDGVINTQWQGNPWGQELRDIVQAPDSSLEDAVTFLADRFHSVGESVSELARYFGKESTKAPKPTDFMGKLEDLCGKVLDEGQLVPVAAAINLLIPMGVSTVDSAAIIGRLTAPWDSAALGELIEVLNATLTQRMAKETAATIATMESEMSGALEMADAA